MSKAIVAVESIELSLWLSYSTSSGPSMIRELFWSNTPTY